MTGGPVLRDEKPGNFSCKREKKGWPGKTRRIYKLKSLKLFQLRVIVPKEYSNVLNDFQQRSKQIH